MPIFFLSVHIMSLPNSSSYKYKFQDSILHIFFNSPFSKKCVYNNYFDFKIRKGTFNSLKPVHNLEVQSYTYHHTDNSNYSIYLNTIFVFPFNNQSKQSTYCLKNFIIQYQPLHFFSPTAITSSYTRFIYFPFE